MGPMSRGGACLCAWCGARASSESGIGDWSPTPWTCVHQWDQLSSNITLLRRPAASDVGNASSTWRILHITDAHISLADAPELHWGTRRMHNAFRSVQDQHLERGPRREPKDTFRRLLRLVQEVDPDAVVLGGDIVNYPHNASVQFVLEALATAGCGAGRHRTPTLFTAGNHDWLVEGLGGSRSEQRSRFRRSILRPLYRLARDAYSSLHRTVGRGPGPPRPAASGDRTAHTAAAGAALAALAAGGGRASRELGDVSALEVPARGGPPTQRLLVLTLDTSLLEVDSSQAAFVWEQLSRGLPALLVVHVPFMLPGAAPDQNHVRCGDPRYGHDGDTGWQVERRERWPREGAPPATQRFLEDLVRRFAAPHGPLVGILSGHEHTHRADTLGKTWTAPCGGDESPQCEHRGGDGLNPNEPVHEGLVQYVTHAACDGGHRIVEVRDARPIR